MDKKHVVYIPAYNCERQIVRVLKSIESIPEGLFAGFVVIDNKSIDNTASAVRDFVSASKILSERVSLVEHEKNYGLGGSFKTAYSHAQQNHVDYLYWLHGDDQAEVSDMIDMRNQLENDGLPALFGARFMPGSQTQNYSMVREYGNRALNRIYSWFLGYKVYELGSGLNAFSVKALGGANVKEWPTHMAFDLQLLFYFSEFSEKPAFFPIVWKETDQVSNADNVWTGLLVLKELFNFKVKKQKKMIPFNQEYRVSEFNNAHGR